MPDREGEEPMTDDVAMLSEDRRSVVNLQRLYYQDPAVPIQGIVARNVPP